MNVVNYNIFKTPLKDSNMQDSIKNQAKTNGRWTKDEHLKFLEGLRIYGKNWKKIEQFVETRTGSQIRSHAQKFFLKLQQNGKQQNSEQSPNITDFKEQAEAPTLNSKSVSEPKIKNQSYSPYFARILDYWTNSGNFDFWQTLVDYSTTKLTPGPTNSNKKASFRPYNSLSIHLEKADTEVRKSQN